MSADQKVILGIFVIYLALNAIIGIVFSKRQGSKQHVSSEKKFFIGGRNMNGLLLAMTTMANLHFRQFLLYPVQVPQDLLMDTHRHGCYSAGPGYFLVLGVLGNKLAMVSEELVPLPLSVI